MGFDPRDPDFAHRVRRGFDAQRFMAHLGARLEGVAPGQVSIALDVREALSQQHGFVHGGAITSILDSAAGFSAMSLMAAGEEVLTVELKTSFLAPAQGQVIVARGDVIRAGRQIYFTRAEAWAHSGESARKIAELSATMMARAAG